MAQGQIHLLGVSTNSRCQSGHLLWLAGLRVSFCLQALEALLPPRPKFVMPTGEHVEEVNMYEYDQTSERGAANGRRGEAYHEDGGDDDEDGPGMQRVQCANQ